MSPRRRNFTVGEANALLPHLREILSGIQDLREQVGERTDQIKILDVIWGRGIHEPANPDHEAFEVHRKAIGPNGISEKSLTRVTKMGCPGGWAAPKETPAARNSPESSQVGAGAAVQRYRPSGSRTLAAPQTTSP